MLSRIYVTVLMRRLRLLNLEIMNSLAPQLSQFKSELTVTLIIISFITSAWKQFRTHRDLISLAQFKEMRSPSVQSGSLIEAHFLTF